MRAIGKTFAVTAGAVTATIKCPPGRVDTIKVAVTPGAAADKGALAVTDTLTGAAILTQATTTPGTFHPRGDVSHDVAGSPIASTHEAAPTWGGITAALTSASDVTALTISVLIDD